MRKYSFYKLLYH